MDNVYDKLFNSRLNLSPQEVELVQGDDLIVALDGINKAVNKADIKGWIGTIFGVIGTLTGIAALSLEYLVYRGTILIP